MLTLGRTRKFIPPPWYKGDGWKIGFDMLQYFETVLPAVGRGKSYGWWRCWGPVTSPTMVTILAAILVKTARNSDFFVIEM